RPDREGPSSGRTRDVAEVGIVALPGTPAGRGAAIHAPITGTRQLQQRPVARGVPWPGPSRPSCKLKTDPSIPLILAFNHSRLVGKGLVRTGERDGRTRSLSSLPAPRALVTGHARIARGRRPPSRTRARGRRPGGRLRAGWEAGSLVVLGPAEVHLGQSHV